MTTRPEDRAYSLLGIFGVNMPILYGEGEQSAFFRLQVMIFKMFPDHSIFVWQTSAIESVVFSEPELGLTNCLQRESIQERESRLQFIRPIANLF